MRIYSINEIQRYLSLSIYTTLSDWFMHITSRHVYSTRRIKPIKYLITSDIWKYSVSWLCLGFFLFFSSLFSSPACQMFMICPAPCRPRYTRVSMQCKSLLVSDGVCAKIGEWRSPRPSPRKPDFASLRYVSPNVNQSCLKLNWWWRWNDFSAKTKPKNLRIRSFLTLC